MARNIDFTIFLCYEMLTALTIPFALITVYNGCYPSRHIRQPTACLFVAMNAGGSIALDPISLKRSPLLLLSVAPVAAAVAHVAAHFAPGSCCCSLATNTTLVSSLVAADNINQEEVSVHVDFSPVLPPPPIPSARLRLHELLDFSDLIAVAPVRCQHSDGRPPRFHGPEASAPRRLCVDIGNSTSMDLFDAEASSGWSVSHCRQQQHDSFASSALAGCLSSLTGRIL
jgi:hypothetical protein